MLLQHPEALLDATRYNDMMQLHAMAWSTFVPFCGAMLCFDLKVEFLWFPFFWIPTSWPMEIEKRILVNHPTCFGILLVDKSVRLQSSAIVKVWGKVAFHLYGSQGQIHLGLPKCSVEGSPKVSSRFFQGSAKVPPRRLQGCPRQFFGSLCHALVSPLTRHESDT